MKKNNIELVKDWAAALKAAGRTPATIEQRTQWIRRLSRETGRDPLGLVERDLVEWLASHEWGPATRKSARNSLKGFYRWAHGAGLVEADPACGLEAIREPPPCPRPVPEDVYGRALAEAGPREHLAILLAGSCGLRASEVAGIHADDVGEDLFGPVLRVRGKGRKVRVVPLGAEAVAGLRRAFAVSPFGWAFPNMNDMTRPVSGAAISKSCRGLLEGHTFHGLRHRFASKVYEASGGDLLAVQRLLGHSSPVTTQRYVATGGDRLRRVALAAA